MSLQLLGQGSAPSSVQHAVCMCKVVFEEQHRHTIAIAIKKERTREGGGAEALREEKALAVLSRNIANTLQNNLVRERQHRDGRRPQEVFQDAASKTTHKLYSSSCFAAADGKFRMSLQEDGRHPANY